MSARGLTLQVARDVAHARAATMGYELVEPGDPRQQIVAACVASCVKAWSYQDVLQRVSVTLPGSGGAVDALSLLPEVGPALSLIARVWGDGRTQVYYSPAAWNDALELATTEAHEEGHVEQIAKAARAPLGTLRWVAGYLGSPELRVGGAEGPSYAQGMAVQVVLGGISPADAAARARRALESYALDDEGRVLADAVVSLAQRSLEPGGGPYGGTARGVLRELAARGVEVPEPWR